MYRRPWFRVASFLIVGCVIAAAVVVAIRERDGDQPDYRLAKVERGEISSTVSATGTVSALVTVDVGSQISGQIASLTADFNSEVKAGQVIARIDPAAFEAKVRQAEADLAVANANIRIQKAALVELEAQATGLAAALAEAREDLKRKRALLARHVASTSVVDIAVATHDQAQARVKAMDAQLLKQKAQIENALAQTRVKEAALMQQQLDLAHTYIRSPVDGVVINRNVDVGQTVAASLQAPVLFTIAKDLTRMQVEVSVDEADIGQVRVGQEAGFTVDSYGGRSFRGRVHQIRKAGKEVSNVVTYTVVVSADNAELLLLPGMTANVTIVVARRENVLKVRNAALRFRPEDAGLSNGRAPDRSDRAAARRERRIQRLTERLALTEQQQQLVRAIFQETGERVQVLRRQGMAPDAERKAVEQLRGAARTKIEALLNDGQRSKYREMSAKRQSRSLRQGRIWILGKDGNASPVDVEIGLTDGAMSEIVRGEVKAGQDAIIGTASAPSPRRSSRLRFGL